MVYILVTSANIYSVFSQNVNAYFDFQTDVTYTGDLTLPNNCILHFSGGTLTVTGNLEGSNTVIDAPAVYCLSVNSISGTWNVPVAYPEWLGAKGDGNTDSKYTNNTAIAKTMALIPGEIRFIQGTYMISEAIYTTQVDENHNPLPKESSNIYIGKNATLKAASNMPVMIMGVYPYSNGAHNMTHLPKIYGGGAIDGNNMASIAIKLHQGYRVMVEQLYIKNVLQYGFVAANDPEVGGSCVVRDCVFENRPNTNPNASDYGLLDNSIAIYNNRADCNYENIMIVDFKVAVKHAALNGKYINVHAWLSSSLYWSESAVFKCYLPDLNLYCCDADTMRKLVEVVNVSYFFANIINCRAYKNNTIVSEDLASSYEPIVIDKGDMEWSQIVIIGGVYWFDVPYVLISALSPSDNPDIGNSRLDRHYDRISVVRYNRAEVQNGFIYDDYVCPLFLNQNH